jgi:hypothetical protein
LVKQFDYFEKWKLLSKLKLERYEMRSELSSFLISELEQFRCFQVSKHRSSPRSGRLSNEGFDLSKPFQLAKIYPRRIHGGFSIGTTRMFNGQQWCHFAPK